MKKQKIKLIFTIFLCSTIGFIMSVSATVHYPLKGRYNETPFRIDEQIEKIQTGKSAQEEFESKQGTLIVLNPADGTDTTFTVQPGDDVRISCSAGWCRSQTLFHIFEKFDGIINHPPHGARDYLDPATGIARWTVNLQKESQSDEFEKTFGVPKAPRFGHAEFSHMREELNPSEETLQEVTAFYNNHYYGPQSISPESTRTVYITFAANAHAILYRLNQTNTDLSHHTVVVIDLDDYITSPLEEWDTYPRSVVAYTNYAKILLPLFDFSKLSQKG